MLNFTVGPVQCDDDILSVGAKQVPYFRTDEFSDLMLQNEFLMKKFSDANENDRTIFITGSGTASMDAVVSNILNKDDKVLIINGGTFGRRFVDICRVYDIKYEEIKLDYGKIITKEILDEYNDKGFTAFIVNLCDSSTGVLYDINIISDFCKKNNLFLIVDAISAFIAEEISIKNNGIDVLITGSQKALACPPGVSIIVLSKSAQERIYNNDIKSYYLNLKFALDDMKRGQTPFTPAVGVLIQINTRLNNIEKNGGLVEERKKIIDNAVYFRSLIKNLPLKIFSNNLSYAVTSLQPIGCKPYDVFIKLKDEYEIWVCPNGGDLKEKIFRVGHIGNLTFKDYDMLVKALEEILINKVRND